MHPKALVLTLTLLLAACGGGAAAPSPTATPATSASPTASLVPTVAPPTASQPPVSQSPTPPLVSVAPVIPASPPPPSPAPPAISPAGPLNATLTITTADEGKTFNVKVGAVINVSLKADSGMQTWALQAPDATILQAIPNPAAAAAQGVTLRSFKAIATGTAAIMASDRPACSPGQACPQFIRGWKVTIVVDPS